MRDTVECGPEALVAVPGAAVRLDHLVAQALVEPPG